MAFMSGSNISSIGTSLAGGLVGGSGFMPRSSTGVILEPTQPAQIGDMLECDVILSRVTTFESEVTQFPVEDGFSISDHCIRKPMKLTLEVLFTPTPVTWFLAALGGSRHSLNRVMDAIMDIWKKGEPVTIKLVDGIYTDMVMTSAPMPRRSEDGYCYKATLEFQHVRRVTQRTEDIPEDGCNADAQGKAGQTGKDGGMAATEEIGTGLQTIDPSTVGNASSDEDIWTQIATGSVDLSQFGAIGVGLEHTAAMATVSIAQSMGGMGAVLW